jgi:hypothetical protein
METHLSIACNYYIHRLFFQFFRGAKIHIFPNSAKKIESIPPAYCTTSLRVAVPRGVVTRTR